MKNLAVNFRSHREMMNYAPAYMKGTKSVKTITTGGYNMHDDHLKTGKLLSYSKPHVEPCFYPVCGKRIFNTSSFKYEFKGSIYHFCSKICREEFSYFPEKYL